MAEAMTGDGAPDVLVGSRNLSKDGYEGYTFVRKLASKTYIKLLCAMGGLRVSDSQCGCKAFSGAAARAIFSRAEVNGFAFDFEALLLAARLGLSVGELPVKVINHRDSKINLMADAFRMMREVRRIKKRVNKLSLE